MKFFLAGIILCIGSYYVLYYGSDLLSAPDDFLNLIGAGLYVAWLCVIFYTIKYFKTHKNK